MSPCMCGDHCCPSCGPLLGNSHCPICNEWASEGCEHINTRTGNLKKRYVAQAEANAKATLEAEQKMAEEWAEEERLAEEFSASHRNESTMSREEIERLTSNL